MSRSSLFSHHEARLIRSLSTPKLVQDYLHRVPYNWEKSGETLRGFRGVVAHDTAHCFEGALFASTVLEVHGHHPRLLSLTSWDGLDHVLCLYQDRTGRFGAVGKSRLLGMCGRKARYASVRHLVLSYFDTYVHLTGRLTGYAVFDLLAVTRVNWRTSTKNLWHLNERLMRLRHAKVRSSDARYERLHWRYLEFKVLNPDKPATFYDNRPDWL